MISSVKDLYPSIRERHDLSKLTGAAYSFVGQEVLLRSNSPALIDLLNLVYQEFRTETGAGADAVTLFLLEEKDQFATIDPGFDSFTCSVPDQVLSFWGAQLM